MKFRTLTKTTLTLATTAFLAATNASLASTVSLGTLTSFTGGDAGEGLDLSGNMIYAFNLGGPDLSVQGVTFSAADRTSLPAGLTQTGTVGNEFDYSTANPGGANGADYGASGDDNALETIVNTVWYDGSFSIDLAVASGTQYQLQLILQESYQVSQGVDGSTVNGRKTDISLEGILGLDDFEPGIETNGLAQAGSDFGMVYTYTFTATDDFFTVSLDSQAGANQFSVLGAVNLEELGADVTQPNIATLDPADDATIGVAVGTDLVTTFDETVQAGTSGTITLRKTNPDELVESFDVTSSPQLTFGGTSVTINPTADLLGGVEYYVLIDADAIVDTSSNGFAGITIGDWSFSPDVTAPGVGTIDIPTNGASDVSPSGSLALTFSEDMQKGTGNIVIKRVSDDGVVDTIDVSSGNVVISGGVVTILPTADLPTLTELYVEIEAGGLEDLAGNSFAGISGSGTWSFTTGEIVLFDDFSSDPNISTEWTEYGYFPPDNTTPAWNSGDGALDLSKPTGSHGFGLYRTGALRSATDSVTLTVNSLDRTGGTWGFLGLMISAVEQPSYIVSTEDSYSLVLAALGGTDVRYEVRRTYQDGTADFLLFVGDPFDLAANGPTTLNIVRNGDHYEFLADDNLLYTTATPAAGDTYDTAAKDSLVYFQIVQNGDAAIETTVDDFGIGGGLAAPLQLQIAESGGALDFSWNSLPGMQYDLVSSTDPEAEPDKLLWAPYFDGVTTWENIPNTGTTTMVTTEKSGAVRFFALIEEEIPPLFEEHFDAAGPGLPAGWIAANATTVWDVGDPSGLPNLQGGDGTNCVGTNVVAGNYADEVATVTLTSPQVAIPAGGATLGFRQYIDSNAPGDVGALRLLDATDTEIVEGDFPVTGIDGIEAGWTNKSYTLPPSAAGQDVKVVFEFSTNADGSVFNGFYLDDVVVTETP